MAEAAILSRAFEQLRGGDTFITGDRMVTEADVVSFATLTGDLHPQHVDPDWSASGAFEEPIAPGLLTLSYAFGLVQSGPKYAIALRALTDVVFTRPVKIGDSITVTGRITGLAPADDETGVVSMTLLTSNQDRKTVCRARIQILWRRDSRDMLNDRGASR